MQRGVEGLTRGAEALQGVLLGQDRLELAGRGLEGAGQVTVLAGQLDLVKDRDEGLDDAGGTGVPVGGRALAGAAHEPLVLLLEVVEVRPGPGQVVGSLSGLGLSLGQGVLPRRLLVGGGVGLAGRALGRALDELVADVVGHLLEGRLDGRLELGVDALVLGGGAGRGHLESSSSTISASTMSSSSEDVEPAEEAAPEASPAAWEAASAW